MRVEFALLAHKFTCEGISLIPKIFVASTILVKQFPRCLGHTYMIPCRLGKTILPAVASGRVISPFREHLALHNPANSLHSCFCATAGTTSSPTSFSTQKNDPPPRQLVFYFVNKFILPRSSTCHQLIACRRISSHSGGCRRALRH